MNRNSLICLFNMLLIFIACGNASAGWDSQVVQQRNENNEINHIGEATRPLLVDNKERNLSDKASLSSLDKESSMINPRGSKKEESLDPDAKKNISPPPFLKEQRQVQPQLMAEEKEEALKIGEKASEREEVSDSKVSEDVIGNQPVREKRKVLEKKELKSATAPFNHLIWDGLVQKHINISGRVNYKGFLADMATFDKYLKLLEENPVQANWPRNKKMAYWINAYNAFTIRLIVDNYPLKSIMDLHGGKTWDVKWIKLGTKMYSLNNIEHDILRPQFKDPRIHFAVNCAAKSCPPIWNHAWTAENLDKQLDQATSNFINHPGFNILSGKKVELSKIFEWYAGDFGDIITYLNKYSKTQVRREATIEYIEYNWSLNE